MTYNIDAIFDNGVFRPLEPLAIPNGSRVQLHVESPHADGDAEARIRRKAELEEFLRVARELPVESPADGFSGADHDRLLYGKP
jgi:predicted DNA-binding antitoxin AbrB/MazE fold protein